MSAPELFSIIDVEEGRLGKKVNAALSIPRSTVIARFTGRIIDLKKSKQLGNQESFAFQVQHDRYVYLDPPYCYVNHSCDPNCGVTPGLELIALKNIAKGEELT